MSQPHAPNGSHTWSKPAMPKGEMIGVLIYLVMAVFAYLTPLDVLDQHPQAREFSDFMASWNPQIRRVGEISGLANQANRFVYSVLWCVMPVSWVYLITHLYRHYRTNLETARATSKLSAFLMWIGLLVMFYIVFALPGSAESSRIGRVMFIHALTRSLFAPGLVYVVGLCVSVSILMPILAFKKRIVIKKDQKNG